MNSAVTHLEDYDTQERFRATVVSTVRITSDETDIEVREITLDLHKADFHLALLRGRGHFS